MTSKMHRQLVGVATTAGLLGGLVLPLVASPAYAATINNDTIIFEGALSTLPPTILTSPSGYVSTISGEFNVNTGTYDGLDGIDTIFFTNFGDYLPSGFVQNVESFISGNGNDVIDVRDNNNSSTLLGGAGNDILYGTSFDDSMFGDTGDDIIDGGEGDDFLNGGRGNDILIGGLGSDIYEITGYNELDTIIESVSSDINTIKFGAGVDISTIMFDIFGNDLLLSITGLGQLLIAGQFDALDSGIDTLIFRDNSTFDLRTISGPTSMDMPEPATLLLFGAGVLGLGVARRRWKAG